MSNGPSRPDDRLPRLDTVQAPRPRGISRRDLLRGTLVGGAAGVAVAAGGGLLLTPRFSLLRTAAADGGPTVVVTWNNTTLQAIRDLHPGPPMVARALAIVHTCMYDAWTAYQPVALPTQGSNGVPKVRDKRSSADKTQAISYAAYRALLNLFPADAAVFASLMTALGYDPSNTTTDTSTPAGIGNVSAQAVLMFRANDGSNQANNYADYTGYPAAYGDYPAAPQPVNTPDVINDPNHWQPLRVSNGQGGFVVQSYLGPHFTASDVAQYVATNRPGNTVPGTPHPVVASVQFMSADRVCAQFQTDLGVPGTDLMCVAYVTGSFQVTDVPLGVRPGAIYHEGAMVFDAHTGNLLMTQVVE